MKTVFFIILFLCAFASYGEGITYSVYSGAEWKAWASDGEAANPNGDSKLEAVKIGLEGLASTCHVKYRAHVANVGWQDWVQDGEVAGTVGEGNGIEALEVRMSGCGDYRVAYSSRLVDQFFTEEVKENGEVTGTTGQSLSLGGLWVEIDEYPNSCDEAKDIALGGSYKGKINNYTSTVDYFDIDLFRMEIPADGTLEVDASVSNAHLWLLDSECEHILFLGGLQYEVEAGTYYIFTVPATVCDGCNSEGDYRFKAEMTYSSCDQTSVCAQNPVTGNWINFLSACDVPTGWEAASGQEGGCSTASTIATYSNGVVNIPRVEVDDGQGGVAAFEVDLGHVSASSPMAFELQRATSIAH